MKTKLLSLTVGLLLGLTGAANAVTLTSTAPRYDISIYWILGPIRTNNLSDLAYDPWATQVVPELYTNKTLVSRDVQHLLRPEYVTQPSANRTNWTLHMAVRVVARNGAPLSLAMLQGVMNSSDNANSFSNFYSISSVTNPVYSAKCWGIKYGPGGERTSDGFLYSAESATNLVQEIDFVGMQCKYFPYADATGYVNIAGYITNYFPDFTLVGSWRVVDASNNILGQSFRTLKAHASPTPPVMAIITTTNNSVQVGINMEVGRTADVYSRPRANAGPWVFRGTMNANDIIQDVTSDSVADGVEQQYYRAILQPVSP